MTEKWLKSTVKQDKSAVEMLRNFRVTLQRMVCPVFSTETLSEQEIVGNIFCTSKHQIHNVRTSLVL